ncbi:Importin alpha subunit (Karyopherin alpha subunit) (Serine-rich RNA polymerase I suppressor protein) [Cladochytrium tenue]|nr:Importin alpha subunit (Karyopherin alpha subunit) (Serine-rich RNA polymerase I suppressor protein) [Cladochytrium tenue]
MAILAKLIYHDDVEVLTDACWALSYLSDGANEKIDAVVEAGTKKEACWAISNATSGGVNEPEIIHYLVSAGCIKPLCDILNISDPKIIQVALDGLENILKTGDKERAKTEGLNVYSDMIETAGGVDRIVNLQHHDNEEIYKKCYSIVEKFYSDDDDAGFEMAVNPETNTFDFPADNSNLGSGNFNFS